MTTAAGVPGFEARGRAALADPQLKIAIGRTTGADLTQYTTFHCGPKRPGDRAGPAKFHIVLVDGGRTRMLAEGLAEMLRCLNHCVVYRQIGGHAYGATYPGPLGPVLDGLLASRDMPRACTLNGQRQEVCPVAIPLPALLRYRRDRLWRDGVESGPQRWGLCLWRFLVPRPALYRWATGAIRLGLMPKAPDDGQRHFQ